ncbi:MAG: ATP-dependent RecD-like DNA helicase [Desulfobacterales bacterium]|nr:ATP-dependent RecD-like DNA helicase [Desulfobacterales bacterium]
MEALSGQVDKVTYYSEETGFTVARLIAEAQDTAVTVVGPLMNPRPGEVLHLEGEWQQHAAFGRQFRVQAFKIGIPTTEKSICAYLGSGHIKGIGPEMASRIVARFGRRTLAVIDADIQQLKKVKGIGAKRLGQIEAAWSAHRDLREIMLFLQAHDLPTGHAARILRTYGDQAVAVLRSNPYRLADDIRGIGFQTADRMARQLDYDLAAPARVEAGVLHLLGAKADNGHVYSPRRALEQEAAALLGVDAALASAAIERLVVKKRLEVDAVAAPPETAVYPKALHLCEVGVARHLLRLQHEQSGLPPMDPDQALAWVQPHLGIELAAQQKAAVAAALDTQVLVITGGPGTGKTTIIKAIVALQARRRARIHLTAPTGRAAKRMAEATACRATTIHRLLEYSFQKGGFQRNADRPLVADLVIVDEASMIDIRLMRHLLEALAPGARLILVGDIDQLPSVGPGNVLRDIIASRRFAVATLTKIYRQARSSAIVRNAHRINAGEMPRWANDAAGNDFFFIARDAPEKALDTIVHLVAERMPQRFGLDPVRDIQVLSPMHRGVVGAANLNRALQMRLNPAAPELPRGTHTLRINDKVMQVRNNYDKDVYNGDIGTISRIDGASAAVGVDFDGRAVDYDAGELDEIVLAYAISVHKSQGSEFPAVVVPVLTQHYILLQRNLLYTAVTRGRRLVVLVGTRKALALAVKNASPRRRFTALEKRLRHPASAAAGQ